MWQAGLLRAFLLPVCVTWLLQMCDMTPSDVWHDSCTAGGDCAMCACVSWWCIHTCAMTHLHVSHNSFTCVLWLIHTGHGWFIDAFMSRIHVTHSSVWHDALTCVSRLIHVCETSHSYVWEDSFAYVSHDSFIYVLCLLHFLCAMTYSHVRHDSFTSAPWLIHSR